MSEPIKQPESVYKVKLSTGREILLREMKIKYQRLALQACGTKAGENKALLGNLLQEELLKQLVLKIDGKEPAKAELENLDGLFSYQEYMQLMSVIAQIAGVDETMGNVPLEILPTGNS